MNEVFRLGIWTEPSTEHYERKVYNINNFFADIGGLFTSMTFCCKIIFAMFKNTIFFSSLVSMLYYAEPLSKSKKKSRGLQNDIELSG
jgi:hypothetical protein